MVHYGSADRIGQGQSAFRESTSNPGMVAHTREDEEGRSLKLQFS